MKQSIEDILSKVIKGNVQAFEAFYKMYHYRLFLYARKFISDDEVIRDLLQEFFIDFWENRDKLTIRTAPESYLFRSIHNRCIDHIRKTTIRNDFVDLADLRLNELKNQYYQNSSGPLNTIFTADIEKIISKVMNELPEQCRNIFILSRDKGNTTQEIAELMAISPRTVESHVYRALKILKSNLTDYLSIVLLIWVC